MIALSFSKVNKEYNSTPILTKVSFSINHGDKLALIGKNGTGKTTLLRLIAGLEEVSTGGIHIDKNLTIGYMTQMDEGENISLIDFALLSFNNLIIREQELKQMENAMADFTDHGEEFQLFLEKHHQKMQEFENLGGYLFRSKARGILIGLGFDENDFERPITSLSGGQLGRLKLARLLIETPDILLLDEPTNHLDIKTTSWLESYLKNYEKTLIIVSHDRFFLDAICNKTMEIEMQTTVIYDGNYSAFRQKKAALIAQKAKEYEKTQKEIKRQEEIIRRFKGHGTELLAKRAKSREKALNKIKKAEKFQEDKRELKLHLDVVKETGNDVLQVSQITKTYDNKKVLENISFSLFKGEKIGLIGDNGSGKTTLLKIIAELETADSGDINYGQHLLMGYYDQNHAQLNDELTIFDEIHNLIPSAKEAEVRTILGRFLFSDEDVFKRISVLSGGEKARVMLTKLFLSKANLLLLDEPTNHLDIYSKEALESALKNYNGSIIAISHDRYFLNKICEQTIELENGEATIYHGNYDYYVEKKAALAAADKEEELPKISKTAIKQDRKKQKEKQNEIKKLKRELAKLESEIENCELRLGEIDSQLCLTEVYTDHNKVKQLKLEQIAINEQLEQAITQWEELSLALEEQ